MVGITQILAHAASNSQQEATKEQCKEARNLSAEGIETNLIMGVGFGLRSGALCSPAASKSVVPVVFFLLVETRAPSSRYTSPGAGRSTCSPNPSSSPSLTPRSHPNAAGTEQGRRRRRTEQDDPGSKRWGNVPAPKATVDMGERCLPCIWGRGVFVLRDCQKEF